MIDQDGLIKISECTVHCHVIVISRPLHTLYVIALFVDPVLISVAGGVVIAAIFPVACGEW